MANGFSSMGATVAQIAAGVWTAVTRSLSADVGITQAGADKAWSTTLRKLSHGWVFSGASPSDTVRANSDAIASAISGAYVKLKTLVTLHGGTIRVKWEHRCGSISVYTKIYRNGIAIGVETYTNSISYVAASDELAFSAGDNVEVWGRYVSSSDTVYVQNFRLCYAVAVLEATL